MMMMMVMIFILFLFSFSRYPRLYHLSDKTSPTSYDNDETQWIGLQIGLNVTESRVFGTQYSWDIASNSPTDPEYHNGIDFWVINETQLTGRSYIHFAFQSFITNLIIY